ncbi:MAG: hypothetical protein R3F35_01260 [Myxococcota bacterium]
MEPYLEQACRRAAIRLGVGGVALIAIVGLRMVTATPRGIEGEIAELERFDAEAEAEPTTRPDGGDRVGRDRMEGGGPRAAASTAAAQPLGADADPDRLVRCHLAGQRAFMRAADCETRGGLVEERPPPNPDPAGSATAAR